MSFPILDANIPLAVHSIVSGVREAVRQRHELLRVYGRRRGAHEWNSSCFRGVATSAARGVRVLLKKVPADKVPVLMALLRSAVALGRADASGLPHRGTR